MVLPGIRKARKSMIEVHAKVHTCHLYGLNNVYQKLIKAAVFILSNNFFATIKGGVWFESSRAYQNVLMKDAAQKTPHESVEFSHIY